MMLRAPQAGLTSPAVAGRGLSEGLGPTFASTRCIHRPNTRIGSSKASLTVWATAGAIRNEQVKEPRQQV
jgi:hypothetical protein